jgi:serine/threonine-protein kinase
VQDEIGAGGMGAVFRVTDQDLGREVAAKTLRPELSQDPAFVSRFLAEAKSTGQLEHPNIIPIHDLGLAANGVPYFTMQLVRGETLASVVERLKAGDAPTHRHFTWARRLALILQVCDAVGYAHSRGVLHRDLKPENVMIGPYGEVIVMDWGLAARQDQPEDENISGTPSYSPPEQLEGKPLDKRSDVYGIAATLYELLTLKPPHMGKDFTETFQMALTRTVPRADAEAHPLQGRVPREVANIVLKALSRDPAGRYATVEELRQDLQEYVDGKAPVVCVHTGFKRATNRLARFIDDYGRGAIVLLTFLLTFPWLLLLGLFLSGI